MTLDKIRIEYNAILAQIEENGGELTPELQEALQINEEDFHAKLAAYKYIIQQNEAQQVLIKEKIDECKSEIKRKQKEVDRLKERIYDAVIQFGQKTKSGAKVDEVLPDGDPLYIRVSKNKPKAVILQRGKIPDDFWKERISRTPDTTAIRDAIVAGKKVPGAQIEESVSVKLKKN